VKKDLTMQPIRTNESNFTYLGPTRETADLPCRLEGQRDTFSVWEPTEEDRKIIAAGGHVRLGIHGVRPIPPVSLQVVANVGPTNESPTAATSASVRSTTPFTRPAPARTRFVPEKTATQETSINEQIGTDHHR
jgi:hypothetical protein